jgi:SAM-dependent methyltransferase
LKSIGLKPEDASVLDAGCGSGHFVNALKKSGFSSAQGFDSFAPAVLAAHQIGALGKTEVKMEKPENFIDVLSNSHASVVSMMCVLVHLENPIEVIRAMKRNAHTRFTFQKIPMWSFATILESAFPNFRSRVLGSDHTNVFTEESIKWIEAELGLRRVASWRFGGDYLDLERKILIAMNQNSCSEELLEQTKTQLDSIANEVQQIFDRHSMASELHVIWELNS